MTTTPFFDDRFPEPGADTRFLEPGADTRFPEPGVDTRFPAPGVDARFTAALIRALFRDGEPGFQLIVDWPFTVLYEERTGASATTLAGVGDPVGTTHDLITDTYITAPSDTARPLLQEDAQGRRYLLLNGVGTSLVTPTIAPGTDKVQVFAGVRKLSDATQIIVEAGANVGEVNGTFTAYASDRYAFASRGSAIQQAFSSLAPAPSTQVYTGLGDISGDRAKIRIGGAQIAQNTADQGNGNYTAQTLSIGARNAGTSLFFNGRLDVLIVRFGPNLSAKQIEDTEKFLAQKTGVDLS